MKKVIFTSSNSLLNEFPELYPQPARNFIPDWYKNMPINSPPMEMEYKPKKISFSKTVKTCPSFMEIFNEGFVMVAPIDIWIRVEKDGSWEWKTNDDQFTLDLHADFQWLNHIPNKNKKIKKVFKFNSPWHAITPKGYSLRQMPMMYDYENSDFFVPYGVIKTDLHHELNPQICYTSKDNEILIKRGQPLNYLIPYKREKYTMSVEPIDKYANTINRQKLYVRSSFRSNYHRYKD